MPAAPEQSSPEKPAAAEPPAEAKAPQAAVKRPKPRLKRKEMPARIISLPTEAAPGARPQDTAPVPGQPNPAA